MHTWCPLKVESGFQIFHNGFGMEFVKEGRSMSVSAR